MRLPAGVHWVLSGYLAGLCVSLASRPSARVLACVAAIALAWALAGLWRLPTVGGNASRRGLWAAGALVPLVVVCGLTVGAWRLAALSRSSLAASVGQTATVEGTILTLPDQGDDSLGLDLMVTSLDGRPQHEKARLQLELPKDVLPDLVTAAVDPVTGLVEGTRLRIEGLRVEPLPEAKPGRFDYGRYLRRRGEHVVLSASLEDCMLVGTRGGLGGAIDRLRLAARSHLRRGLRPPVREVLEAMVLGDDNGVDEQVVEDFRRSGLLHIMAVSGENVVLLCSIAGLGLRLLGLPRSSRMGALIPLVCVYVVVTGASPSIMRAGVAGVLGLLAAMVSRPADGWLLLLAPGAYLMSFNPYAVFDVSFQLSFAAVVGLLLLSRPLTRALSFLPETIAEQAGVTTAASLATAPVSIITFGSASVVSVVANVLAGFALGPIMLLGMISVLVGFVSSWLSLPLNLVAGVFIGFMLSVAALFGRLSFATYEWHGVTLGLLLTLAVLAEVLALRFVARRRGVGLAAFVSARRRRGALVLVTAVVIALALVTAPASPAPPRAPTLTFLSVGEGAAALLQVPGGPTVLIDAGPDPLAEALRRHGVDHIDLLVLSHGHADHTAGLADVLGRVPVERALLPFDNGVSESLSSLRTRLAQADVAVTDVKEPMGITCGDVSLAVLPTGGSEQGGNQGENDLALVCVVTLAGESILLPGDCEGEALDPLALPHCAVVELPHHGSAGGFVDEQISAFGPRLAVISVGDNSFGHPTAEMLELLATHGVPYLRTDRDGAVVFTAGPEGLTISAEAAR